MDRMNRVAATLVACLLSLPVHAAPEDATVVITSVIEGDRLSMFFSPETLTVAPGTTVTFRNDDGSNHFVRFADGPVSGRLKHHAVYTRTFAAPGEYRYACTIHPQMTGTIVVR